ncbi:Maturation and nuclear export of 40S ribosomal subunits interacting protein [Exophiala oligosperma]
MPAMDNYTSLIASPMTVAQRKHLLKQLQDPSTISSLRRPEILMDFFVDSLDMGDLALAVPALTGLFHLITTRNLDYPAFYPRLYALLDKDLLHNVFLSPTNHLPAATVASFIKRLSRLCLFAPPSAIVAIIPFIYNLLKTHPTTTFMIHRNPYPPYTKFKYNLGNDPYDPTEPDPQLTGAIDSSLWELETCQSHYHPTVASIARIISEQFTKQQYNLEDFLDHGYASMMESEFKKKDKKPPVVEYKIPKRIFSDASDDEAENEKGDDPLMDLWTFE